VNRTAQKVGGLRHHRHQSYRQSPRLLLRNRRPAHRQRRAEDFFHRDDAPARRLLLPAVSVRADDARMRSRETKNAEHGTSATRMKTQSADPERTDFVT